MTHATILRTTYVLCTYIQIIYVYMYCIERSVNISIKKSQGLITYAFVMLLLAMISIHMITLRLMVTMVAELCSLVILIHNTKSI